MFFLMPRR